MTLLEWVSVLCTEGFGACINQKMNLLVVTPNYNVFSNFNSFDWLTGEASFWKKKVNVLPGRLSHICVFLVKSLK